MFLKRRVNAWEYVGRYRAVKLSFDTADVIRENTSGRSDIIAVLYLQAAA